mgnify:CR=1 FL=1
MDDEGHNVNCPPERIVRLRVVVMECLVGVVESVALKERRKIPDVRGVPERVPLEEKVSPGGRECVLDVHEKGGVPPLT